MPVKDTIEAIRNAGRGEYIRITDRDFVTTDQLKSELNELCDSHERMEQADKDNGEEIMRLKLAYDNEIGRSQRMEQALADYADPAHWAIWRSYGSTKGFAVRYKRGANMENGYDLAQQALKDIEPAKETDGK